MQERKHSQDHDAEQQQRAHPLARGNPSAPKQHREKPLRLDLFVFLFTQKPSVPLHTSSRPPLSVLQ